MFIGDLRIRYLSMFVEDPVDDQILNRIESQLGITLPDDFLNT